MDPQDRLRGRGFFHIEAPTDAEVFNAASSHPRSRGGRALASYFAYLNLVRIATMAAAGLDQLVFATVNDADCGFGPRGAGTGRVFGHRFLPFGGAKDRVRQAEVAQRVRDLNRAGNPYNPAHCDCTFRWAEGDEPRTPHGLAACEVCLPLRATKRLVLYLRMVVGNLSPDILLALCLDSHAVVGVTLAFADFGLHEVAGMIAKTEAELEDEPGSPWKEGPTEATHRVACAMRGDECTDIIYTRCDNTDYVDYHHGGLFTGPMRIFAHVRGRPLDEGQYYIGAAPHFITGLYKSGHCAFSLEAWPRPREEVPMYCPETMRLAPCRHPAYYGSWRVGATISRAKFAQVMVTVDRGDATLQAISLKVSATLPGADGYTRACVVEKILSDRDLVDAGRDMREAALANVQPGAAAHSAELGRQFVAAVRSPARRAVDAVGESFRGALAVLAPAGERARAAVAAAGGRIAAPVAAAADAAGAVGDAVLNPAEALPRIFAGQHIRDTARRALYAVNWLFCAVLMGPFGVVAAWVHYAACEFGRRFVADDVLKRAALLAAAVAFVAVGGPFGWANLLAIGPMLLSACGGGVYSVWLAPLIEESAKRSQVGGPTMNRVWTVFVCLCLALGDVVAGGNVSYVTFAFHVLAHKTLADLPMSAAIAVHAVYNAVVLVIAPATGAMPLSAVPSLYEFSRGELTARSVAVQVVGATVIYALARPLVRVGLRVDEMPALAPDLGGDVQLGVMESDGALARRYFYNFLTGNGQALVAHTGPEEVLHAARSRHIPPRPDSNFTDELHGVWDDITASVEADRLARFSSMPVLRWTRDRTAGDKRLFREAAEDLAFDGVQAPDHVRGVSRKPESFAPAVYGPGGAWDKGYKGRNITPNRPKRTIGVGRLTKAYGLRFLRRVFRNTHVRFPVKADPAWYSAELQRLLDEDCSGAIVFGDDVTVHFAGEGDQFHCTDVKSMDAFMNVDNTTRFNDIVELACKRRACDVAAFWDRCALQFLRHNEEAVRMSANGFRSDQPGMNSSGDGDTFIKNCCVAAATVEAAIRAHAAGVPSGEALDRNWSSAGFEITRDVCPLANVVFCQMINFPCGEHVVRGRVVYNRFAPHVARLFRSVAEVDRGPRGRDDVAATGQSLAPFWGHLPFFGPVADAMLRQGDATRGQCSGKFIRPHHRPAPVEPYAEEFYCSMLGIARETWRDFCEALSRLGTVPGAVFVTGDVYEACVGYLADPCIVWC